MASQLFQAGAPRNGSALTSPPRNRVIDPSTDKPWEPERGPDSGFAVPHVLQFSSILGSAWSTYWHGHHDEAMRFSWEDAWAMRNDTFIRSLIDERKLAVASLKWELETDNDRDPWEKAVKAGVTQILRSFPRQADLTWSGMEAIWPGRNGDQFDWEFREMNLPAMPTAGMQALGLPGLKDREKRRVLTLRNHQNVEGDKIDFDYSGNPYVLVNGIAATKLREEGADVRERQKDNWVPTINAAHTDLGLTAIGGRALFLKGSWRQRFRIHTHECLDSSFFQPWKASSVHGVGIRSVIFWYWWLRQEFLSNVTDWCARTGLGVRVWYYDASSDASYQKVKAAATDQTDKVNIMVPRFPGADAQEGVNFIDTTGTGADLLLRIVEHTEQILERYIVGQSMSAGSDESSRGFGDRGRTDLAKATKAQITKRDAEKLGDTDTQDIVKVVLRWSYPEFADLPLRKVYNVDNPDPEAYMGAAKLFCDMGGTVRESEARRVVGFSEPHDDEPVLGGQTPVPPGMGGGGVPTESAAQDGAVQTPAPEATPAPAPTLGQEPQKVQSGTPAEDSPLRRHYAKVRYEQASTDKGHWVTIGAKAGHGGSHVYIEDGRITKGHRNVVGKSIKGGKLGAKPANYRPLYANEKRHGDIVAEAKRDGIDPKSLHWLADDMLSHDEHHKADVTNLLRDTRQAAKAEGINIHRSNPAFEGGDFDKIVGFDLLARRMAGEYPGLLGAHGYETDKEYDPDEQEASQKLFDFLVHGNPEPMTEEEAYQAALNHIREHGGGDTSEMSDADESGGGDAGDFDFGDNEPLGAQDPAAKPTPEVKPDAAQTPAPAEPASASRKPVRSEQEAHALFASLPASKLSGRPRIAEQIASKFAGGDRDKWDELAQVATDKIYDLALHAPDADNFEALASTAVANHLRNHFTKGNAQKRGAGKVKQFGEDFDPGEIEGGGERPESAMMDEEKKQSIQQALGALDDQQRQVAELVMQGSSLRDIQEKTGISPATASRILKRLQPLFEHLRHCKGIADKIRGMLVAEHFRYQLAAKVAVSRVLAEMDTEEKTAAKVRYEAQRKRESEDKVVETKLLEAIADKLDKLKPAQMDLKELAAIIRDMPPPVINVTVPEAIDMEVFTKALREMPAPVVQMPEQKARTVKITKGKDGQYTAKVE